MSMNKLQDIRKKRAQLSAERARLKEESVDLRIAERDEKNTMLSNFLAAGNFRMTHGNVRRIRPRWRGCLSDDMRNLLDTWETECTIYDAARQRLINQKIELLTALRDSSTGEKDLSNFIAINFKGAK